MRRHRDSGRQLDWLERSTLTQAVRIREFLNRSLGALPAVAGANLARRFRHDPPFGCVFFEMIVGRFLQVLGAAVEHQPVGAGGISVDWRRHFPMASSSSRQRHRHTTRLWRSSDADGRRSSRTSRTPAGWWVAPRDLPNLPVGASRRAFRGVVRSLFASLPATSGLSIENRIRLEAPTEHGAFVAIRRSLAAGRLGGPGGSRSLNGHRVVEPLNRVHRGAYLAPSNEETGPSGRFHG